MTFSIETSKNHRLPTSSDSFAGINDSTPNGIFEESSHILRDIYDTASDFIYKHIRNGSSEEARNTVLEEANRFSKNNLPFLWLANRLRSIIANLGFSIVI